MRSIFELMCCGRFTAQSERLYCNWTNVPPCGVKTGEVHFHNPIGPVTFCQHRDRPRHVIPPIVDDQIRAHRWFRSGHPFPGFRQRSGGSDVASARV